MKLPDKLFTQPLYTDEERKIFSASRTIGTAVLIFAFLGLAALWIWALGLTTTSPNNTPHFWAILAADVLLAFAAAAAGAVFGFIFGIPRTMNAADRAAVANAVSQEGVTTKTQAVMATNTNLERISDWLTTLLIGATLVQIKEIVTWIGSLGAQLGQTGTAANDAIAPIIIILFFCLSFLGVYLVTRLYLTSAFSMQALALLSASNGQPAQDTGTSSWTAWMVVALNSGSTDQMLAALKALDDAKLPDSTRVDPVLSASEARLLARIIKENVTAARPSAKDELIKAVDNAVKSSEVARKLRGDFDNGVLETGDTKLNEEVDKRLPKKE